ncbi:SGNH/GDSL hydrolase family protein [Kibdelosporangium lantanae]|uniref:SGNH/GDSL hydrolase family protein n=1 Tax=Kibdelosporangium lantanae TaxID=1497396 RepID=A0ABW3M413_9PSEU
MFADQTVRLVVHTHAGGKAVRLRLSNTFGDRPLSFGRVTVGLSAGGGGVIAPHNVTFADHSQVTVPKGQEVVSDPVALTVKAEADLAVSVYLPTETGPATYHRSAHQTNYVSAAGDHTTDLTAADFPTTVGSWFFLDSVSVSDSPDVGTVVALGDSITDGSGSSGANHRWPDYLAARVADRPESVVDVGIAGNKVLMDDPLAGQSALNRLERDVLSQPGLRTVIVLEGINDLRSTTPPATADQIIGGYRKIIDRVHARGARILGATITPVKGSARYDDNMERARQAVNTWIRTSHAFNGVVDFAAATQDPGDPLRLLPAYDSGDHLHLNNAGYQAMADSVDLRQLR